MLVINQRCIRNGNIDLSVARGHKTRIPKEKFVEYGDALINSTGVGTLGRISIVEYETKKLTVDSHVTICRANKAKINSHYLSNSVKKLQGYFEYMATGATGQVELNRKLISDTKIVVPDEELQGQFSDIISPIWKERSTLTLAVNILSSCRKLLLGRLISGKLPVESLDIQFPRSMQNEQDVAHAQLHLRR
jgi:type I restriction enzyme S subunit